MKVYFRSGAKGFTLVELLVVISIIALLLSILMPALNRARDAGRSVVCKSNLKTMGLAEILFAQNNDGKVAAQRDDRSDGSVVYFAAQLWSAYNNHPVPAYGNTTEPSIKAPKWLMCPSQKVGLAEMNRSEIWADGARAGGWTKFWLQNIGYIRNGFDNKVALPGKPVLKRDSIDNPSRMADIVDGGYIWFYSHELWSDAYLPSTGKYNKRVCEGGTYRTADYRHEGKAAISILLWDGHVESARRSISDKYLRLPKVAGR